MDIVLKEGLNIHPTLLPGKCGTTTPAGNILNLLMKRFQAWLYHCCCLNMTYDGNRMLSNLKVWRSRVMRFYWTKRTWKEYLN